MKKSALLLILLVFCNSFANTNSNKTNKTNAESEFNSVQIVRLNFTSPNGSARELILGFTSDNSASDGVDYGYDATVNAPYANDLNWLIEENRYVIQGVGSFDNAKQYLFGLYSEASGTSTIELTSLENFNSTIDVFIYDALLNTYTRINDTAYTGTIDAGNYTDRFYIAFSQPETDNSDEDNDDTTDNMDMGSNNFDLDPKKDPKVSFLQGPNQLKVGSKNQELIKEVHIYNYKGKILHKLTNINQEVTYLNLNTNDKNIIIHIVTEETIIVKQVALDRR